MKVAKIIAAVGLMTATLGVSAAADAQQQHVVVKKTVVTSRHTRSGPVHVVHRKVCKTEWRHHRRVRVCR